MRAPASRAMEFKDYYATLGVSKTACEKEIKQAFRKMARKYHPDVNPGDKSAESRFKEINEAYEVIGDPEKRKSTTSSARTGRCTSRHSAGVPAAIRASGAGRGGAGGSQGSYRTMTAEEMRDLFGNDDPFSDFFHAFFSGGGEPICAAAAGAPARLRAPAMGATSSTRSTSRSKMPTGSDTAAHIEARRPVTHR